MIKNNKANPSNANTPQSGFAALEALLIVIILAILGFTGWYVWHSKQAKTVQTDQHTVSVSPQADPLQHRTYRNTALGLELSYPGSWGQPKLETGGDPDKKTSVLSIGKLSGDLTPRGYTVPANAGGSVIPPFTYDGCKTPTSSSNLVVTLYSAEDTCVIIDGGQTAAGVGANFVIEKKFSDQAKLPGLRLTYPGATASALTASAIKGVNQGTSQELIDLAQSIKEID